MKHHDYKDTIKQAAGLDEIEKPKNKRDGIDAETAIDALSLTAAMGTYAQDETVANLLELELAAQLAERAHLGDDGINDDRDPLD